MIFFLELGAYIIVTEKLLLLLRMINFTYVTFDLEIWTETCKGHAKGRSTIDQINTIITIVEERKSQHKSTFAAFIDLRKAYDCVNRSMLWYKLREYGVSGNMKVSK